MTAILKTDCQGEDPIMIYVEWLRDQARISTDTETIGDNRYWKCAEVLLSLSQGILQERAAWREMMKGLGRWLAQAKQEGALDKLIEGNVWPEPACVISQGDVERSIQIARDIRPQIEAEREWRTIDSAPKDGRPILVFSSERCGNCPSDAVGMSVAFWSNGAWSVGRSLGGIDVRLNHPPTHWMPLPWMPIPSPPKPLNEREQG